MDSTVRRILGLREHKENEKGEEAEEGGNKISPSVTVYLTPEEIGDEKGAHCGACFFFNDATSECFLTSPTKCNAEHGVCSLFLGGGKNLFQEAKELNPQKLVTKKEAGYVEEAPTRCSLCEYWQGKTKEDPDADIHETATCAKVKGQIQAGGCCNGYEPC
jgi:hypothetical protein